MRREMHERWSILAIVIGIDCMRAAAAQTSPPFLGATSLPTERGAEVTSVVPNSPAAKAGIVAGDIVRSVDGFLVGRKGTVVYSLPSEIRRSSGAVRLTIRQRSTARMVDLTADVGGPPQPAPPPSVQRRGRLGVLASNSAAGETITELFPDTPAAAAGLKLNDVITSVGGFKIGRIDGNVYSLPSEVRRAQGIVELKVRRAGEELTIPVDLGLPTKGLATKAHVLLIALTNDESVGKACAANLSYMKGRVLEAFEYDKNLLDLKTLEGNNVTADNVLRLVDETRVAPTETFFCYYCGHGAYDPRFAADDPSLGHLLQIPGEDLLRRSLRDHLIEKAARLTVLITDTCNVRSETRRELMPRAPRPTRAEKPLFTHLMRNAGVVDISGTSRDEYGWAMGGGCVFTLCLDDCLGPGRAPTWEALMKSVTLLTDDLYREMRSKTLATPGDNKQEVLEHLKKQEHQTPTSFILSVQAVAGAPAGQQSEPALN